jgi:UDPglucose--hexose-1-phosphate uridylyltransferase
MKKTTPLRNAKMLRPTSELRQDIVSGEWVLVATGRARRSEDFARVKKTPAQPKKSCPFEDPQKSGNPAPLLWYPHPGARARDDFANWFVQVIPNKYPAVIPHAQNVCSSQHRRGIYSSMDGVGYHEVIITRKHEESLGLMSLAEAEVVIRAYRERYMSVKNDPCLAYVLVFHNHGREAGASVPHPHSQIIALPIVPPDVVRSFAGSERFFKREDACVHCRVVAEELKLGERIVYENERFVALAPYASHSSFELRIYPKRHNPRFETVSDKDMHHLADALTRILKKLYKALGDPAYNFFIHTAPLIGEAGQNYHWHLEILPKTSTPAGLELGTGVDVVVVSPEDVPRMLK